MRITTMKKRKRNSTSFEIEDSAVAEALTQAESFGRGEKSRLINEAIRHHGGTALLEVLYRDVEIAESKYRAAQKVIGRKAVGE